MVLPIAIILGGRSEGEDYSSKVLDEIVWCLPARKQEHNLSGACLPKNVSFLLQRTDASEFSFPRQDVGGVLNKAEAPHSLRTIVLMRLA
jgi:hypothetical protein